MTCRHPANMQVSLTNLSETIIRSSESLSDVCIGLEADMMPSISMAALIRTADIDRQHPSVHLPKAVGDHRCNPWALLFELIPS
jgi:hypothetical protein